MEIIINPIEIYGLWGFGRMMDDGFMGFIIKIWKQNMEIHGSLICFHVLMGIWEDDGYWNLCGQRTFQITGEGGGTVPL